MAVTTYHLLRTTYHVLLTTSTCYLLLNTYYLLLILSYLLTTHHLPLTTYHLPLTTYHLPLTTYHLPLTTYYLLLTTCHLPLATCYLSTYYLPLVTYYLLPYYLLAYFSGSRRMGVCGMVCTHQLKTQWVSSAPDVRRFYCRALVFAGVCMSAVYPSRHPYHLLQRCYHYAILFRCCATGPCVTSGGDLTFITRSTFVHSC